MNTNWSALDNAAKLFPAAVSGTETQVFRFTCELYSEIQPSFLQEAAEDTLDLFPTYRMVLKRGLFWYYLEESDLTPGVTRESQKLCRGWNEKEGSCLLFEVTYFGSRISLEVYHVLSDGTSAMNFLRTLVTKYISRVRGIPEPDTGIDASHSQFGDDSYNRYYSGEKKKRPQMDHACRVQGNRYQGKLLRAITGMVQTEKILEAAHRHRTTVTVFLAACMIQAIAENVTQKEKKKPIVLSVPVNFRTYFPSQTARNFFGSVYVEYNYNQRDGTFEDILLKTAEDLKNRLTRESLARQLDSHVAAERNPATKAVPLFLKKICLKRVYQRNMKSVTATISNVGAVKLPEVLKKYIRSFDVCSSTNKIQACICSYEQKMAISFTTPFVSADIERCFFRRLTGEGIEVEITTNLPGECDEE